MTRTDPLAGQSIVVTGAGSGLGRSIAIACAADGANVALCGRNRAKLEETAAQIEAATRGAKIIIADFDVTSESDQRQMFTRVVAEFGGLDGVVANAGVMATSPPVHEFQLDAMRQALDTNLLGAVLTISLGAKILVDQKRGGAILATGSSIAVRAAPAMASYSTSKAALHAFMKVAALDLAPHRIRVNTLVPGPSATPPIQQIDGYLERVSTLLPLGEPAQPDEIGRYAAFVLSGAVPHMTGAVLMVDSGRTIA